MNNRDPNQKNKKDEFGFSSQFKDYQNQNNDQLWNYGVTSTQTQSVIPQTKTLPKQIKVPQTTSINTQLTQKQKKQEQKRANTDQFYETILKHEFDLRRQQVRPYRQKMEWYIKLMDLSNIVSLGYLTYFMTSLDKKWFRLTSNVSICGLKFAVLFIVPTVILGGKMQRHHYQFYKKNEADLQQLLTKQEKKNMKLADLLQKYQ